MTSEPAEKSVTEIPAIETRTAGTSTPATVAADTLTADMLTADMLTGANAPRAVTALSPSRAADFKSCPLKFRFRSIDRLPEPPSAAAARGTLVHAALERMFRAEPDQRTESAVSRLIPGLWDDMVNREPALADLPEVADVEEWFDIARGLLHTYFGMEDPTRFTPDACELRLEVTLAGGVPTRGFVDRLDKSPSGLLRIVDYKTGRSPRAAYTDQALFQLKFYALMLYRLRGIVAARLRLLYLGDGGIVEFTPDEAGLLAFERQVGALWQSITRAVETGSFPPKRSKLCDWCSFKPYCPEFGGTPPPYPYPDLDHVVSVDG